MCPLPINEEQTAAYPAPQWDDEERSAYLFVLSSATPTLIGKSFKLAKTESLLGRAREVDVQLDDQGISRQHAKVLLLGSAEYAIVDLASKNGTYVNGERVAERANLKDGDKIQVGETVVLLFTLQDAVEEQFHKNLYESATRDALTGAFNKKYFVDALQIEFAFSVRHAMPMAVLMLDVDHFKAINDTHGHLAGDEVLLQVAQRVAHTLRKEDVFGRYGGEEFAVLLRQTGTEAAMVCAERCRRGVESLRVTFAGSEIQATLSVGVAVLGTAKDGSAQDVVGRADQALYKAKHTGRNRVVCDDGTL